MDPVKSSALNSRNLPYCLLIGQPPFFHLYGDIIHRWFLIGLCHGLPVEVIYGLPIEHLRHVIVLLFLELHVLLDDGLPVDGVLQEGPLALRGRRVGAAQAGARRRRGCGWRLVMVKLVK